MVLSGNFQIGWCAQTVRLFVCSDHFSIETELIYVEHAYFYHTHAQNQMFTLSCHLGCRRYPRECDSHSDGFVLVSANTHQNLELTPPGSAMQRTCIYVDLLTNQQVKCP